MARGRGDYSRESVVDEFLTRFLGILDSRVSEQIDSFLIAADIPKLSQQRERDQS